MQWSARITFAIAVGSVINGQTAAPPRFEIADVRASPRRADAFLRRYGLQAGRYEMLNATMLDLIAAAYGLDEQKVIGGPNWLELDRFDVIAETPPGATPDSIKPMLQALLADRFKLKVHMDTRPVPAFALVVAKGKPKMTEAEGSGKSGCEPGPPQRGRAPYRVLTCHHVSMALFAQILRGWAAEYFDNPVVDATGLKGFWDFELKWTQRWLMTQAGGDGINVYDAVDKQLGIKLELRKIPSSVIVVDSVNEKPAPNPPEAAKFLPPPAPSEFEVADIKPSAPAVRTRFRINDNRVDLQGVSLHRLLRLAWGINSDEMISGEPNWTDGQRFNVLAEVSTNGPTRADIDDIRRMLRALLKDRFKLASHMEDRPVTAYTLVADKPRLTKADPANRTSCKEGRGSDVQGKDPRDATPILERLVTCHNITMAQFADQLPSLASGYIHNPVLNATGIEGAWDFTLSFTPVGLYRNPGARTSDGGQQISLTPVASDPSGALTVFDAVKKLGLRLDMRKRPMPVLVIDHLEENPTDN